MLLSRRNKRIFFFFLLWVLVPTMLHSNDHISPRYFFITLLPLYWSLGFILANLFRYNKIFKGIVLLVWVFLFIFSCQRIYPIVKFRHEHALLPDYFAWLGRHTSSISQVIAGDGASFLKFYGNRTAFPRPIKSRQPYTMEELMDFKTRLDERLDQNIPLYATDSGLYSYDADAQFSSFVIKNYRLRSVGMKWTEDWHREPIYFHVYPDFVYQIEKKLPQYK